MDKIKNARKLNQRKSMVHQQQIIIRFLDAIFTNCLYKNQSSIWLGLFDLIIFKTESKNRKSDKKMMSKINTPNSEIHRFNTARLLFDTFNFNRVLNLLEYFALQNKFESDDLSHYNKYFHTFADAVEFVKPNQHKRPSNLQLYVFYTLLRFAKFFVLCDESQPENKEKVQFFRRIKDIFLRRAECKNLCEILSSKEHRIDSDGHLPTNVSVAFVNEPKNVFEIREKLVVSVLKERTFQKPSFDDFDEFELVNDLVDDF